MKYRCINKDSLTNINIKINELYEIETYEGINALKVSKDRIYMCYISHNELKHFISEIEYIKLKLDKLLENEQFS